MKKYSIFLTKSNEVAEILAKSFEAGKDGIESVESGVGGEILTPMIGVEEDYFYCVVTYKEDALKSPCVLVIA